VACIRRMQGGALEALESEGTVGGRKEQAKEGRKGRGKVKVGMGRFTLGPGVLDVSDSSKGDAGGVRGW